jgi:hypothetical protein
MPAQPQSQLSAALRSLRSALVAEPEPKDKATLKHALNLVQRVYEANKTETGYGQMIEKHLKGS